MQICIKPVNFFWFMAYFLGKGGSMYVLIFLFLKAKQYVLRFIDCEIQEHNPLLLFIL